MDGMMVCDRWREDLTTTRAAARFQVVAWPGKLVMTTAEYSGSIAGNVSIEK